MGFFQKISDTLTSTKRPAKGTPKISARELKKRILAINRETAPFKIYEGESEGVDLIAEWKIVDAQWYGIFSKSGIKNVFKIYMKFDEMNHEVRTSDREYAVSWTKGVPKLSLAASSFRGQKHEVRFDASYGFTEEFKPGQIYKYKFSTSEIKKPIQKAVTEGGWTYKGIAFGKL